MSMKELRETLERVGRKFHSGGVVRPAAPSPLLRSGETILPRHHTGVISGLRPDEVATVLSPGWESAPCRAYQFSDQMVCPCGLQYDTNDPSPPICPATQQPAPENGTPTDRA